MDVVAQHRAHFDPHAGLKEKEPDAAVIDRMACADLMATLGARANLLGSISTFALVSDQHGATFA